MTVSLKRRLRDYKMREININEEHDSRSSSALFSGDSPRANPASKLPKRKSKSSVFKPSGILRKKISFEGDAIKEKEEEREKTTASSRTAFWNSGCQFVEDVPPAFSSQQRPAQSRTHTPISIVNQRGASTTSDRARLSPLKMCSSVVT